MGICASAETRAEGNSASKYRSEEKISSNDSARSRTNSGANVTERKIENALAAQHRKKKARMVVTDRGGVDAQDPNFECPHFPKSATQTAFLTSALSENFFMFPELEQENQSDMVGAMKEMTVNAGEQLMKQGDQGDKMYVVESGNFDILVDGQIVSTAGKKKVIGELALVYQAPRAASVICTVNSTVWALERNVFRNLISSAAAKSTSETAQVLSSYSLFENLSSDQKALLCDVVIPVHFASGETIVRQGEEGNTFYIIKSGSVTCVDEIGTGAPLTLESGMYFGELALINNKPRARSVTAREATDLLALSRDDFQNILGSVKDTLKQEAGRRVLQTCEMFPAHISSTVRDKICEAFKEITIENKGEEIVKKGDVGHSMFVVGDGEAAVYVNGSKVKSYKHGEYFGEIALTTNDSTRTATVVAESDVLRLYELGRADFNQLLGPLKKAISRTAEERKQMTELKTVKFEDLKFVRNLGQGTFGLVKLLKYTSSSGNKHVFALKCMQKQQIVNYKLADNVLYEKQMMVESDHPFVLKLYRTYQDANSLMMLLEIVPGGELFTYLQTLPNQHVSTKHARFISLCVVAVFDYIHSKGICYRDLKPENLMIDGEGYIKMVDFGFAKVVKDKTFTLCGTPEYMAPEIILRKGHAKGVDYWATGILIWECETGETPFADYENFDNRVICENILRKPITIPRGLSSDIVDILVGDKSKGSAGLLRRRVTKRLGCLARGAQDIIDKPYFKDIDYQKLLCKEIKAPYVPKVDKSGIDQKNFDPIEDPGQVETYTYDQKIFASF